MTLRNLKIFIAVCEYKSTVAAADNLHIAQPSISFAIKEIETHYGIKLFDRISRKLILTQEGKVFLYQAREIINKVNQLESSIKDCDSTKKITLGCSTTIAIFLLPNILKQFDTLDNKIRIKVIIRDSKTLSELILKNEIDLALIETPIFDKVIESRPFFKDSLLLYLSKDNPLANKKEILIQDLEDQTLILREKHSAVRTLIESAFIAKNINTNHPWDSSSTQAIISLVDNNLGISILPSLWKSNLSDTSNIITKEIDDLSINREYLIINHKSKYLSPAIKEFIKICLDQAQ